MHDGERYSVAVLGGTPGGIAAAVRAAREGHDVVLATYNDSLGGMMAGGLSYTDTVTTKPRTPLLEEFTGAVREHYRSEYGEDSRQYERCENGYVFEPHVAEEIFEELVDESNLTVHRGYHPVSAERAGRTVESVTLDPNDGDETRTVSADVFVEATYEGDLAAVAGAPYSVGREARSEYDEQFAGRLFTGVRGDRYFPRAAVGPGDDSAPADRRGPLDVPPEKRRGDLDLVPHPAGLTEIHSGSTGCGDDAIQAYNYRLCLSCDPDNRRRPGKPDGYDRAEFLDALEEIERTGFRSHLLLRYLPNDKADMNAADLPGENHDYPEAGRERRAEIAERHREHALGLLYFLQNDDAVPDDVRAEAREWGLAEDEFTDSDNVPWQLYVREARRVEGRYTFTENDARHAEGIDRTPVHGDAVAIAEYPLDSHACTTERRVAGQPDGFFYASQVTRPSQVPYRTMLPKGIDNLLVPVPLSATHVGYGTIRLEPTWMHVGESAGVAAALARERARHPADLDVSRLQRRLVDTGVLLSFFNDCDVGDGPCAGPVHYLGTKGFFDSYDARPDDPLTEPVATAWVRFAADVVTDESDPTERARELPPTDGDPVTAEAFGELLTAELDASPASLRDGSPDTTLSRAEACRSLYAALAEAK